MFFPPMALIRRKHIVKKLLARGAVCPEKAVSFWEAGIINPYKFRMVTRCFEKSGLLHKVEGAPGGRWYLDVAKI